MKSSHFLIAITCCLSFPFTSFAQDNAQAKPASLNHIAFYVADLKIASTFYRDFFDLKEIPNPFNDQKHTWFSLGLNSALHIISGAKTKGNYFIEEHLCFSTPSIEIFIKKLKAQKITYMSFNKVISEVTLRPDGVHQLYLQDPDGHWIEVNDAKL
ncbi:VOC family protein [Pedobacter frigiditerrae]|uniref:VOC family protein n=1 Tax=Pedobacter frigiditerrae TaxID=2530452 RepID=UPI00292EB894|nr:VOC family protein [Pedobacter frigiditerrae]